MDRFFAIRQCWGPDVRLFNKAPLDLICTRHAVEMGDILTLNAIAAVIKTQTDFCVPLSKQIVRITEDFDLYGIQELADVLDAS